MPVTESGVGYAEPGVPSKQLDSTQVTTGKGLVDREGVVVSDPSDPAGRAAVSAVDLQPSAYGEAVRLVGIEQLMRHNELLASILTEMRVHTELLLRAAGLNDDVVQMRKDQDVTNPPSL